MTMGRDTNNHLTINDKLISRMHARIEIKRSRFMLVDQSTNGTFIEPEDGNAVFLRRDATQLKGKGLIGLGQRVSANDPVAVHYKIFNND